MRLKDFFHLIIKNWALLIILPIVTAVTIYYFTKDLKKEYSSDTVIYTGITSGINLKQDNNSNYFATSKAFSNLLTLISSRETKQEVALNLLAQHIMLDDYDPSYLNWNSYTRFQDLISRPLQSKLKGSTIEETLKNLNTYLQENSNSVIHQLLNSEEPNYSLEALSKITAYQVGGSDLMKVEYSSSDPAICRQTLEILSHVFIRRHKDLMTSQNESVVSYYQEATEEAAQRLKEAELSLLDFHQSNDIVNYTEKASSLESNKQSLLQQYNALEMQYAGANSALKVIEENLKDKGSTVLQSQEIISLRNQLSKIKTEISDLESFGGSNKMTTNHGRISSLKQKADLIEDQIRSNMEVYYAKSQTVNGVASKDLLDQWIRNTILVEEMKAQLAVMRKQIKAFDQDYEKVAPMGADLVKLQREVEMAEKNYMSLLANLGQSQLNKQNIELTSHLKIVDPAFTPSKANSSKRKLLILLGAAGAFFMTLAGILAVEFSFPTLKNPYLAFKHIGFPVIGTLPRLDSKKERDIQIAKKAEEQLAIQLILKKQSLKSNSGPFVVGVLSSLSGEGKTTVVNTLSTQLKALGMDVFNLFPSDHGKFIGNNQNTLLYNPLKGINHNVTLPAVIDKTFSHSTVILIEFPALLESPYPIALLQQLDLILITVRSDREWKQADKRVISRLQTGSDKPIEVVLNGVKTSEIEELSHAKLRPLKKEDSRDSTEKDSSPTKTSWENNIALNT